MEKLPKTLPSESFQEKFRNQLDKYRFKDAREAWSRLERAGCEPLFLLMDLEIYCSHVIVKRNNRNNRNNRLHYGGYIREFLETKESLAADWDNLAQRLTEDANRIEQMKREPEFLQKLNWYTKGSRLKLPDDMRSYASWLKSAAKETRGTFSLRDHPGQSIRSAADYIKSATGKDRFSDLASLVRAGYAAHGHGKNIFKDANANALGKAVRRARQRMQEQVNENPISVKYPNEFGQP